MRVGDLVICDNQEIDVAVAIEVANGERPLKTRRVKIAIGNCGDAPGYVSKYIVEFRERRWLGVGRPTYGISSSIR